MKCCELCLRKPREYGKYCYECAELMDQIIDAKAKMKRWSRRGKQCGCSTCENQRERDKTALDELIAIGAEVRNNGW